MKVDWPTAVFQQSMDDPSFAKSITIVCFNKQKADNFSVHRLLQTQNAQTITLEHVIYT
jgi:hypothetical protein